MSKKKENKKVNKKNNDKKKNNKKKNNKKFKDAFSIRIGPRLETWLVWLSMFALGVAFLAFGNIKFFTRQIVETVNSVPVWTQVETETVTTSFISDSNNTEANGGYLNYYTRGSVYGDALNNYNVNGNYYGDVDFSSLYTSNLRIYTLYGDNYFKNFAPQGFSFDSSSSYFNYYIEQGSNLTASVSSHYGGWSTTADITPDVIHSIPYSEIGYNWIYLHSYFVIKLDKIDPFNDDPDDNLFRLYPSVDLIFKSGDYVANVKSYENFRIEEKITKKTEMVLNYEDRYSYHYEYKLNMSMDEFAAIGTNLFNDLAGYLGKILDVWDFVYDILSDVYEFVKDGAKDFIGGIKDLPGELVEVFGDIFGNFWDWLKDLVNINSNVIIPIYANNNSVVLRR